MSPDRFWLLAICHDQRDRGVLSKSNTRRQIVSSVSFGEQFTSSNVRSHGFSPKNKGAGQRHCSIGGKSQTPDTGIPPYDSGSATTSGELKSGVWGRSVVGIVRQGGVETGQISPRLMDQDTF